MIAILLALGLTVPAAHRDAAQLAAVVHAQDPDLLLALAYVESRWTADVVSKSGRHCGALQSRARDKRHCQELRSSVRESYRAGAMMLAAWLIASKGSQHQALASYACGHNYRYPRCQRYATRVLAVRDAIRKASVSLLEEKVEALQAELNQIKERVRLRDVAARFISGHHEIREGDFFLPYGKTGGPTRLAYFTSDGKWAFNNCEHGMPPSSPERLYTIDEVGEILAAAARSK